MLSRCFSLKHPFVGPLLPALWFSLAIHVLHMLHSLPGRLVALSVTNILLLMQHLNAQLPADKRSTFDSWDSLSSSIRAVPAGRPITPPPGMPPLARVPLRVQQGHNSDGRTRRNQRVVHNDLYTVSSLRMCECISCHYSSLLYAGGYLLACWHCCICPGIWHCRICPGL